MSGSLGQLIPEFQPYARALVDAAGAAGLQPRITSTLRTRAEQTRLYNRYLAGAAQFPAAPPGTSAHEFGYAFDMVVSPFEALADVGAYWQQMGGKWGPSDPVHFEYPGFKAPPPESDNNMRELLGWFVPGTSVSSIVALLMDVFGWTENEVYKNIADPLSFRWLRTWVAAFNRNFLQ